MADIKTYLLDEASAIPDRAVREKRGLTAAEKAEVESLLARVTNIKGQELRPRSKRERARLDE